MAAVSSSLLDDLNDLHSDEEEEAGEDESWYNNNVSPGSKRQRAPDDHAEAGVTASGVSASDLDALSDDEDVEDDDEDDEMDGSKAIAVARDNDLEAQLSKLTGRTGYRVIAKLRDTRRFQEHMASVDKALALPVPVVVGTLEEWPEYRVIVSSNHLIAAIDEEIIAVYRYAVDLYSKKFPELESIVPNLPDYVRTVKAIGNEMDLTLVDLASLLPSATVMVVTVTGSTTLGKPLTDAELADVLGACDEVLALEDAKHRILQFVESRMSTIAPNVSSLLGTRIAAQLVALAGGLTALSNIPACNVQVIGQKKKALTGFSRAATNPHVGVLNDCDIVQSAPPDLRRKAVRVLAAKVVMAARVDSFRQAKMGEVGSLYRKEVTGKVIKWQEPPPGKQKKPLPAPDDRPSRRRGGKRFRKLKEKMGMTDVRKEANRMSFATSNAEYSDAVMGVEVGMLGSGTGKLRLERKEQKIVKKKKLVGIHAGSSGATGGVASSLAFTPSQGIELINPGRKPDAGGEKSGYFSTIGSFSVMRKA
jgi:U4/U6 small nuclear ribonucleoprotein PRP31